MEKPETPAAVLENAAHEESVSGSELASFQSSGASAPLPEVRHDVMASYLYHQQANNGWRSDDNPYQGVMLRSSRDRYLAYPPALSESDLAVARKRLNVQVRLLPLVFPLVPSSQSS